MKPIKKLLSIVLVGLMTFSLVACDSSTSEKSEFEKNKDKLSNALDVLSNSGDYIISTSVNAPDSDIYYITVNTSDGCYTEYPVDSDGNYGTLSYKDITDNQEFMLTDYWVDSETSYFINPSDDGTLAYKYPAEYSEKLASRGKMYFPEMLEEFTSIKYKEKIKADIGNGEEELNIYECVLPSSYMHDYFGKTNQALYSAIVNETKDEDIKKLCQYYLDEYDMTLTFSDANVFVGIDNSGKLKYVDIMVGGLGSKMYMVMSVLDKPFNARTKPDFSNALNYIDSLSEVAKYVSDYDSVEEGLNALSKEYSNSIAR